MWWGERDSVPGEPVHAGGHSGGELTLIVCVEGREGSCTPPLPQPHPGGHSQVSSGTKTGLPSSSVAKCPFLTPILSSSGTQPRGHRAVERVRVSQGPL